MLSGSAFQAIRPFVFVVVFSEAVESFVLCGSFLSDCGVLCVVW